MQLIVFAVILFFVIRFIIKKVNAKKENEEKTYAPPAAGSRAEKAAIKEFKRTLAVAKRYGAEALEAKEKIRDFYEIGYGTEKNLEMAARWNMDAAMETMRCKVVFNEFFGVKENPGFLYGNFKWFTKNGFLKQANELAMLALKYGYSSSSSMLSELERIKQEKVSGQQVENGPKYAFESLYGAYLAAQAGIQARSETMYREWKQQIGQGKSLAQKIDLLLKKADWAIQGSGTNAGIDWIRDAKFQEAYRLEAQGTDFKKVAGLYEILANEGNHEAQRRLARLNCNVFSAYINDEKEQKGKQLLASSAQSGNAMAAYEMGQKEFDLSQIVAWAKDGYRDAIVVLGTLLEQGNETYKPNWDASQIAFHILYEEIGDAEARKDGEGLWMQLALGMKMGKNQMMFIDEMVRKCSELGYAPALFDYAHRTRLVARDASKKYQKITGADGRYSEYYNRLVWESAQKPIAAGYAKAVELSKYHRAQENAIDQYVHSALSDAEEGKDSWGIGVLREMSPQQRVAFEAGKIQVMIDAASTVRMAYGQISLSHTIDVITEKQSYHPDAWIQKIEAQQSADNEIENKTTSARACPSIITDDMGRDWYFDGIVLGGARFRLPEGNFVNPQFDLGDSLGREIVISDAEIEKGSAKTIGRTFHW